MTARTKKTDNHDPAAKLDLRRHFLRKYHANDPPNVLDCCQGSGRLWDVLRREFPLAGYWGVDVKPKKGRLKIDSARILAQPGWPQNVIDVDSYGCPWEHWAALVPNVRRPVTVFLTVGRVVVAGGSPASRREVEAAGATFQRLKPPQAFGPAIACAAFQNILLTIPKLFGKILVEAAEAVSSGNARYVGVRLEPKEMRPEASPPGRDTPTRERG